MPQSVRDWHPDQPHAALNFWARSTLTTRAELEGQAINPMHVNKSGFRSNKFIHKLPSACRESSTWFSSSSFSSFSSPHRHSRSSGKTSGRKKDEINHPCLMRHNSEYFWSIYKTTNSLQDQRTLQKQTILILENERQIMWAAKLKFCDSWLLTLSGVEITSNSVHWQEGWWNDRLTNRVPE